MSRAMYRRRLADPIRFTLTSSLIHIGAELVGAGVGAGAGAGAGAGTEHWTLACCGQRGGHCIVPGRLHRTAKPRCVSEVLQGELRVKSAA